jgi:hypothetical protein
VNEPDAVFHLDGNLAIPTDIARGPWSPHAQHGGAPSALLAGMIERFEPSAAEFVARLTVELMRPVPLAPLRVECTMVRPGKKVQLVQASLFADDTEVSRATALRIRTIDPPHAGMRPNEVESLPAPGEPLEFPSVPGRQLGFWDAVQLRRAYGNFGAPSDRTAVWFRLRIPVIAGEETSPLQRVAALADFGNGMGMAVDRARFSFINPDLTVTLHRYPVGEWIGLDGASFAEGSGIGVAETVLRDEGGRIGRGVQTILLDEWPAEGRPDGAGVGG